MLILDTKSPVWRRDADGTGYSDALMHNAARNHAKLMADGGAHGH